MKRGWRPKERRRNSNIPKGVTKAVFGTFLEAIRIL